MKINSLQIEIDGIDKEILRDLMEDARKPILQIANKIGISGAAIHQRLRKLEQAGVISGSKFIVNTKVLGYSTMAFVGVYLDKAASFLREMAKWLHKNLTSAFEVTHQGKTKSLLDWIKGKVPSGGGTLNIRD